MNAARLGPFLSVSKTPMTLVSLRLIGALAGMAVSLLLTRALGAEQYGHIAQALSLCMILSICCTAGIEAGSAKFMIPAVVAQNRLAEAAYITFSLRVLLTLSGVVCLFTAIVILSFRSNLSSVAICAILTAPVIGFSRILSGFSIGYSNIYSAVMPRSFMRPLLFLALIFALETFDDHLSPRNIMLVFMMAVAMVCGFQIWAVMKKFKRPNANTKQVTRFDMSRMTWLCHGALIGGAVIFIEFYQSLAVVFSSFILAPNQVGLFDISLKLVGFVGFTLVAVNQAFLPRNAKAFAKQDFQTLQSNLIQASGIRFVFGLCAIALACLLGPTVLAMFGPEFSDAVPTFITCLGIPTIMVIFGSPSQIISLWKSPETLVTLVVVSLLCLALGVSLGAQIGGPLGAAWGVNFAWLVWAAGGACITIKHIGIDTSVFAIFRKPKQLAGA